MDKSGNILKAIIAAPPDLKPIREIEFGCEHLQEFVEAGVEAAERLTKAYSDVQRMLAKPAEAQTTKDSKDPTKISVTSLKPTYPCLQCATISSSEDRDAHGQSRRHYFSIESRSGCLYCGLCDDFIYDPKLETIRIQQDLQSSSNGRKRKLSAIYPLGEEDKIVLPNSNLLSCLAGAPRGIFNLGMTCYMSVILQAMIHNPLMRNFFLSCRHETTDCPVEYCVACALTASFVDVLATEKIEGHGPIDLLYRSWQGNPGLAGYRQQDAHEYFQSLLDRLHNSCGCTDYDTSKPCECLYHQTFFGKLRSTITCSKCRTQSVSEDPIVDLSLDLHQQVKKRKLEPKKDSKPEAKTNSKSDLKSISKADLKTNFKADAKIEHMSDPKLEASGTDVELPLELSNCLHNFTSPEKLGGEYKCKSKQCNNTAQKAKKHMTIKKLPPAMCIQLKRYEQTKDNPQKINTKLNFPLQLDMAPYTTREHNRNKKKKDLEIETSSSALFSPTTPRSPGWYDLSTVVVHIGKMDSGHYLCYCRHDDQWFKFDDSKVTLATEQQVLKADAYLLFYIIRSLGSMGNKSAAGEQTNGSVDKTADGGGD